MKINIKTTNTPLDIETYFFPLIQYRAIPDGVPEKMGQPTVAVIDPELIRIGEDGKKWQVGLRVSTAKAKRGEKQPYDFDIVAVGVFTWNGEDKDEGEIQKIVGVSGSSILYSAIRELLSVISGRGPWDACLLPTRYFKPVVEEEDKKEVQD
jgi:preprotein translocase subunit SecB